MNEPFFDRKTLAVRAAAERRAYREAKPFPHVVLDGFLEAAHAQRIADRFPRPDHPDWVRKDYPQQSGRLGQLQRSGFVGVDPAVRHLLNELGSMAFLDFLTALSGIEGLVADPHFVGAGPSITLPGGHLALHADFNRDRTRDLARVLTVLYYCAPAWDEAWGGALELWDAERTRCEVRIAPLPNRLVVMAHGDRYWHGHPTPLASPPDRYRASIGAYYYVVADTAPAHGAIWA